MARTIVQLRGGKGLSAAEQAFLAGQIAEPTQAALDAFLRAPALGAADQASADVDALIAATGEAFGQEKAALTAHVAAKDGQIDAAIATVGPALAAAQSDVDDAITELGETTSQKVGEVDDKLASVDGIVGVQVSRVDMKLTAVDGTISGQVLRVDTKLGQADTAIAQAQTVVAQGVAVSSGFSVASVGPAGTGIANTAAWNFSRPSRRGGFDVSLNYEEVADNQLQAGYDLTTGIYIGALFAGARANLVRANRCEGFTAGVVTTGSGKLPTANGDPSGSSTWAISGSGGLTLEVVQAVTVNGMKGLRMRASGTATSTSFALHFETTTGAMAGPSKTYTSSFYMRLFAAPGPPTSFRHRVRALTAAGGAVSSDTATVFVPTASVLRFQRPFAFPATSTIARVDAGFGAILVSGNSYDFTFDIFAPQIEDGGFASTFMQSPAGVSANPVRAEGVATVAGQSIASVIGQSGCMVATVSIQGLTGPDGFGVLSLGDGTQNNVLGLLVNATGTGVEGRVVAGGVTATVATAAMTAQAAGTLFKVALAWDGTNIQVAARGTAGTKIAQTVALPKAAITQAMIGRFGALNPLFGSILSLELRPAPSFDSALALLTA
ncbi:hypothetical protein [Sphingomonas faeni]|uniref:hypothetical protein n=1 Tax=Sphingomonas faeni TaxID=185950 RepID=UPI00335140C6